VAHRYPLRSMHEGPDDGVAKTSSTRAVAEPNIGLPLTISSMASTTLAF